jgi:hypothetical protein
MIHVKADMCRLWDMLRDDGFAPDVPWQTVEQHTWDKLTRIVHQIEMGALTPDDERCQCECDICVRCEWA